MTQSVTDTLDASLLLKTLIAFRDGDFSARLPVDKTGLEGKIADTLNDIFKLNERMASEFERISSAVGKEGRSISARVWDRPRGVGLTAWIRSTA